MDLTKAAKDFLLVYFSDGLEHSPSDFDIDILGGFDTNLIISGRARWDNTPFYDALTELVEDMVVGFKNTDDGWIYFKIQ